MCAMTGLSDRAPDDKEEAGFQLDQSRSTVRVHGAQFKIPSKDSIGSAEDKASQGMTLGEFL